MPSFTQKTLLAALAGAMGVAAHGHVKSINVAGAVYDGFDASSAPYDATPKTLIAWSTTASDNGFVGPEAYGSGDIICHRGAKSAKAHAKVKAGEQIYIQWDTWPKSHAGPVIDMLASCGSKGCESVDKESLKFFKIAEAGMIKAGNPATYASDELIANNNGWLVEIPENIKPGSYVLRHEIIALHAGGQENGAQNYPQCFNLEISGSGTELPEGTLGTALYKANDKGIKFDLYNNPTSYPIPGPALMKGAKKVTQGKLAEKSKGTPTTGSGSGSGSGAGSAAPEPAKTEAPAAGTSAAAPAPVKTSPAAGETATPVQTEAPAAPKPTKAKTGCKAKKARRHARDMMN
ncbi:putative endoglucanase IV precursor [Fusarium austroafricanum]|uniref:lytic cellulose monooxygenase (C4-dehydrogenating) n=1 Tax=Fusarium austroafricanum TaxID=2364996 RepID=A0A8H4KC58_9HYPO|nr:putative endoglucanase IV precursor [Fusarium austroafricanum]